MKNNDKKLPGNFILNVATPEEAEALLQTDPAIKEKIFDTEIFQFYVSAALPVYLEDHERIRKNNF